MGETEMEVDHYAVLGLPSGAEGSKVTQAEIRKAYRARALVCHPDKRPNDQDAAAEFLKIQTAYDLLSDASSRGAFDDLLRLREERRQHQQRRATDVSSKRQKMMHDLSQREKAYESEQQRRNEEERIAKRLQEEIAKLRARYATKKSSFASTFGKDDEKSAKGDGDSSAKGLEKDKIVKVSWDCAYGDYTAERLQDIFKRFGAVEDIIIRRNQSKKRGSAIVVLGSPDQVVAATKSQCGDLSNPLLVKPLVESKPVQSAYDYREKAEEQESVKGLEKVVGVGYQAFEDNVLERMRKAAQKAKAAKQSQNT